MADTSNKHNIAVRVHYDSMLRWAENDEMRLLKNKDQYAVAPHELLVAVNGYLFESKDSDPLNIQKSAYPLVVSNVGDMPESIRALIKLFNNICTHEEYRICKDFYKTNADTFLMHKTPHTETLFKELPTFTFGGVALGTAYAHPSTGDTVAGSQIGGIVTVRNGHFPVCTGDKIQWYFTFEAELFKEDGSRGLLKKKINTTDNQPDDDTYIELLNQAVGAVNDKRLDESDPNTGKRKRGAEKEYGTYGDYTATPSKGKADGVIHPKPFRMMGDRIDRFTDRMRVFGVALSSARPWDNVDILIGKQSI